MGPSRSACSSQNSLFKLDKWLSDHVTVAFPLALPNTCQASYCSLGKDICKWFIRLALTHLVCLIFNSYVPWLEYASIPFSPKSYPLPAITLNITFSSKPLLTFRTSSNSPMVSQGIMWVFASLHRSQLSFYMCLEIIWSGSVSLLGYKLYEKTDCWGVGVG